MPCSIVKTATISWVGDALIGQIIQMISINTGLTYAEVVETLAKDILPLTTLFYLVIVIPFMAVKTSRSILRVISAASSQITEVLNQHITGLADTASSQSIICSASNLFIYTHNFSVLSNQLIANRAGITYPILV